MMTNKSFWALAALTVLTGCGDSYRGDFSQERAERTYRTAMDDYRAGHLEQAAAGFKKACAADPTNASARFQLACLLQDSAQDYLGAVCAYTEYLLQQPTSDKAKLAEDRLKVCERELAKALADKYGLNQVAEEKKIAQELRASLAKAEEQNELLQKNLGIAARRNVFLKGENDRLRGMMRAEVEPDAPNTNVSDVEEAKQMLAEDESTEDGERPVSETEIADVKALLDEDPDALPLKPLTTEERDQRASEKAAVDAARLGEMQAWAERHPREERPETYVIQDGDTLYKLAVRFYGRSSAWKKIREANKAVISTDGRVKTGQKIVLPKE